jgi:GH25 family lysozyme M1 (1,4-beta-N-acetylmuramidase)
VTAARRWQLRPAMTTRTGLSIRDIRLAALSIVALAATGCGAPADDIGQTNSAITSCAPGSTVRGVDVSIWQGHVDWAAVKRAGYDFALTRVSDGTGTFDPTFNDDWAGIKSAGMVRGVYQFFEAGDDGTAQADLLLRAVDALGGFGAGDLPPIVDIEAGGVGGQSGQTMMNELAKWVTEIKAKTGKTPMIYTAPGFWDGLPDTGQFAEESLDVADWGPSCPDTPSSWSGWSFWQYSSTGSVPGISGAVDIDLFNGSLTTLQNFHGGSGPSDKCSYGDGYCTATMQCDNGYWVPRSTDPAACTSGPGASGGGGVSDACSEGQGFCMETLQCDAGHWIVRSDDPNACTTVKNVSEPCSGGDGYCTATLQCDGGKWVPRSSDPASCTSGPGA